MSQKDLNYTAAEPFKEQDPFTDSPFTDGPFTDAPAAGGPFLEGPFTQGPASYPILTNFCVTCLPLEGSDVKTAKGDILAAFVGDECRGTYVFDDDLWFSPVRFNVHARKEGETVTLKYYHAGTGRIFTFVPTATTSVEGQSLTVRM